MSKEDYLKVRTFDVQWINHPEYGNSTLICFLSALLCLSFYRRQYGRYNSQQRSQNTAWRVLSK